VKRREDGQFLEAPDVELVEDGAEDHHPLAGLTAALAACAGARAFAVAGDMPLLRPALVRTLWALGGGTVIPLRDGRPEPFCAAYGAELLPGLRDLLARGAPAGAAAGLPGVRRAEEGEWRPADPEALSFLDVDTPEDLVSLRLRSVGTAPS
jgi:molybdopterin-guanine dinucleotide biosynthesis protein A